MEDSGKYKDVQYVGGGSFGEIYSTRDVKVDRQVAIKFLQRQHTDLKEHSKRAARIHAKLNHRYIVTMHDVGKHDGPFIRRAFTSELEQLQVNYNPEII